MKKWVLILLILLIIIFALLVLILAYGFDGGFVDTIKGIFGSVPTPPPLPE